MNACVSIVECLLYANFLIVFSRASGKYMSFQKDLWCVDDCKRPTGFYKLAYPNSGFPQRQKPVLGTLGGDQRNWLGTGKVARNLIPVCAQIKLGALRTSGKLIT